jgi:hypothetical protein
VCPRAPDLAVRRLPTRRTLARWRGWVHITCPGAAAHQRLRKRATGPGCRRPCIDPCRFTYQPRTGTARSPGAGRGPQSGAGHWSAAASTILDRGVRQRSSKWGPAGNLGGVDTRRPCRQGEPADSPARGYDQ